MKNRIFALSALILCCAFLSACGARPQVSEPSLVLGFSQLGSESSFRIGNTRDIEEKAQQYGISLMMDNANQKQENQINAIRRFIAYRVDVIAFSPIVEEGWDNVLREARQAGIPVILVDRTVQTEDSSLYVSQIGADFYQEGVLAAQYLIRKADELGKETLRIAEITGTETSGSPLFLSKKTTQTGIHRARSVMLSVTGVLKLYSDSVSMPFTSKCQPSKA